MERVYKGFMLFGIILGRYAPPLSGVGESFEGSHTT